MSQVPPAPERRSLTPRQREVLEAIVAQYVQTGAPVSSRVVSRTNSENLSPASLRSIMADLEEGGYITHPHTSAGRVPTDLGYRAYVDALDGGRGLSHEERRSIRDSLFATGDIDSLVARCCKLLAVASNQVGIGTEPDQAVTTFRHVEFVALAANRILVLFIAASGLVRQAVVATREAHSPQDLERYANFLNQELQGRSLVQVRERILEMMREERAQHDGLARRALELAARCFSEEDAARGLHVDGTEHLLDHPDAVDFDRMKQLLSALEDKGRLLRLLDGCLEAEGVVTAIGSETGDPQLSGLAVVATSYRIDRTRVGTLGILGPTRMEYERAISLVGHVAELLGTALGRTRS